MGLLALSCYPLVFEKQVWITPLCLLISIYIIFKFHFTLFPFGKLLESAYSNILFGKKTMSDLSQKPQIVINATNLETGKLWIFNQLEMKDTTYEYGNEKVTFLPDKFPISRAVASSSCVPFAFTPIPIGKEFRSTKNKDSKASPRLVDGGVYDNQGIHKLVQENSKYNCKHVIVSDAGYTFPFGGIQKNQFTVLIKVMDILMLRIKNQQMINAVYENTIKGNRQIAYFSLGWEIENVIPAFVRNFKENLLTQSVLDAHELADKSSLDESTLCEYLKTRIGYDSIVSKVSNPTVLKNRLNVSTNLKPLTFDQSNALILHAEIMCTLFVKLHCPGLISNTHE